MLEPYLNEAGAQCIVRQKLSPIGCQIHNFSDLVARLIVLLDTFCCFLNQHWIHAIGPALYQSGNDDVITQEESMTNVGLLRTESVAVLLAVRQTDYHSGIYAPKGR